MRNQAAEDEAIRKRLQRLIKERSQAEIARKTGSTNCAVSRYVHGTRIPAAFCATMVHELGVNPNWLLAGEGSTYLAEVPEKTAALGENMLEMVEAMTAVSRMLLGSLAGKQQLKVLRELNESLLAHEKIREQINQQVRPVFRRTLDDLKSTLDKRNMERAIDLRKAADQLARLCDDEELNRGYLRACAYHDFQLNRREDFLSSQRELFLRSLSDTRRFDEQACDEARRIALALVQMQRIPEAMRLIRAVRALAGREGRQWEAWLRLESLYASLLAETGQLYRGLELKQKCVPRLNGMHRATSEAELTKMLLWSNLISTANAIDAGSPDSLRSGHIIRFACWQLDANNLSRALHYTDASGAVGTDSHYYLFAKHLKQLITNPSAGTARQLVQDFKAKWGTSESIVSRFKLAVCRCELERMGGRRKQALTELWKAEEDRCAHKPDYVASPLDLATHYRAALKLLSKPKNKKERMLVRRAKRHFERRISNGFLCFQGVV